MKVMGHETTKVLVVDDHELVRSGISRLLSDAKGIEVVGEAESGEEAVQFAKEYEPDIVLMDIRMPGIGGLEATRKIIRQNEEIQVIAVTACDDNPYASRLLQAGASGYITKGADAEEMVNAITICETTLTVIDESGADPCSEFPISGTSCFLYRFEESNKIDIPHRFESKREGSKSGVKPIPKGKSITSKDSIIFS